MLDGELLYTKILEVNLFAFAYRLFHEDFSSINGALHFSFRKLFVCPLYRVLSVLSVSPVYDSSLLLSLSCHCGLIN